MQNIKNAILKLAEVVDALERAITHKEYVLPIRTRKEMIEEILTENVIKIPHIDINAVINQEISRPDIDNYFWTYFWTEDMQIGYVKALEGVRQNLSAFGKDDVLIKINKHDPFIFKGMEAADSPENRK